MGRVSRGASFRLKEAGFADGLTAMKLVPEVDILKVRFLGVWFE